MSKISLPELVLFIGLIVIFIMNILKFTLIFYESYFPQDGEKQEHEQITHFKKNRPVQSIVEIIE